jgi:hypothetical protein
VKERALRQCCYVSRFVSRGDKTKDGRKTEGEEMTVLTYGWERDRERERQRDREKFIDNQRER